MERTARWIFWGGKIQELRFELVKFEMPKYIEQMDGQVSLKFEWDDCTKDCNDFQSMRREVERVTTEISLKVFGWKKNGAETWGR